MLSQASDEHLHNYKGRRLWVRVTLGKGGYGGGTVGMGDGGWAREREREE